MGYTLIARDGFFWRYPCSAILERLLTASMAIPFWNNSYSAVQLPERSAYGRFRVFEAVHVPMRRLRAAREEAGLSQEQLASRIGHSQSFVSKFERAERRLDVAEVRSICRGIGISFVDLMKEFEAVAARSDGRER